MSFRIKTNGIELVVDRRPITKYTRLDGDDVVLDYSEEILSIVYDILGSVYYEDAHPDTKRTLPIGETRSVGDLVLKPFPKISPEQLFDVVCALEEMEPVDRVYQHLATKLLAAKDDVLQKYTAEIVTNILQAGDHCDKLVAAMIKQDLKKLNRVMWLAFPTLHVVELTLFAREPRGREILSATKLNNYFDWLMQDLTSVNSFQVILKILRSTGGSIPEIGYTITTETVERGPPRPLLIRKLDVTCDVTANITSSVWSSEFYLTKTTGEKLSINVIVTETKLFYTFKTVEVAIFCPPDLDLGFQFLDDNGDLICTDERKQILMKVSKPSRRYTVMPTTKFRTLVVLD